MKVIDVLAELAGRRMTLDEVEKRYNDVMYSPEAAAAPQLLGLSSIEWTAFAHGVYFDELARWRENGWPLSCAICGQSLRAAEFEWLARNNGSKHELVHIACL